MGILFSYGASLIDANNQSAINSPEAIAAFDYVKRVWDSGAVPAAATTWDGNANNQYFIQGDIGVVNNSNSILGKLGADTAFGPDDVIILPNPEGPAGLALCSGSPDTVTLFKTAKLGDAREYARYLLKLDTQVKMFETMGFGYYSPVRTDVQAAPLFANLTDNEKVFMQNTLGASSRATPAAGRPHRRAVLLVHPGRRTVPHRRRRLDERAGGRRHGGQGQGSAGRLISVSSTRTRRRGSASALTRSDPHGSKKTRLSRAKGPPIGIWFLVPTFVVLLVIVAYPTFYTMLMSLFRWRPTELATPFVGLKNFAAVFRTNGSSYRWATPSSTRSSARLQGSHRPRAGDAAQPELQGAGPRADASDAALIVPVTASITSWRWMFDGCTASST